MTRSFRISLTAAILVPMSFALRTRTGFASETETLTLISPHWYGITEEFERAFKKEYKLETGRDIELKWLDVGGGSSSILQYIETEYANKPDGIGVDIFFGGGTDPYVKLNKTGRLAPFKLPDAILSKLAPDIAGIPLYAPDYTWYAATMAGFGIIYNKKVLKEHGLPAPTTWTDLAKPEYAGLAGSADPGKSGSMHMAYEIILQAYGWIEGWRIITLYGANCVSFTDSASKVIDDVELGNVAMAPAIDFYAKTRIEQKGDDLLGYVLPENLTVVNGDAIGILKGAPNRFAAERFVTFVMSEKGQKLWLLKKGDPEGPTRYTLRHFSVMPCLYDELAGRMTETVDPFKWKSRFKYDARIGSARYDILNDLVSARIIEPHEQLAAAWKQAIESGTVPSAEKTLGAPPITEEKLHEIIADDVWADDLQRQRILVDVAAVARRDFAGSGHRIEFIIFAALFIAAIGFVVVKKIRSH